VKPQITDLDTWNQAEKLLQPAFIRLLDNFRKALESSLWQSHYEDIATWPDDTTAMQKEQDEQLIAKLDHAKPNEVQEIEHLLAQIPEPAMAYELQLSRDGQTLNFDMWQLCYQVCFCNYVPGVPGETQAVAIDAMLLDDEGEVDWAALDNKVKAIVERIVHDL
jgi:hypothetical protein